MGEGGTAHADIILGSGEQEAMHFQRAGTQAVLPFQIQTHYVRSCLYRLGQEGQVGCMNQAIQVEHVNLASGEK